MSGDRTRRDRRRRLARFFDRYPDWTYAQLEGVVLDVPPEDVDKLWDDDRITVEQYRACLDIQSGSRRIST